MLMYLALGCLMDAMAMIILTIPIIFPVITALGFATIFLGVIPFVVTDIVRLVILIAFPVIATYLPNTMG